METIAAFIDGGGSVLVAASSDIGEYKCSFGQMSAFRAGFTVWFERGARRRLPSALHHGESALSFQATHCGSWAASAASSLMRRGQPSSTTTTTIFLTPGRYGAGGGLASEN